MILTERREESPHRHTCRSDEIATDVVELIFLPQRDGRRSRVVVVVEGDCVFVVSQRSVFEEAAGGHDLYLTYSRALGRVREIILCEAGKPPSGLPRDYERKPLKMPARQKIKSPLPASGS